MKNSKALKVLVLALALIGALTVVSFAADTVQNITAQLSPNITVKLDGEAQTMRNENGVTVYPLVYNGNTYLPIRSIAYMLDLAVDWDQATKTVLLGTVKDGVDLIDEYKAYASSSFSQTQSSAGKTGTIGGENVTHWLYLGYYGGTKDAHFNLGGKYDSITFKVYADYDLTLTVSGDNGFELGAIKVTGKAVPQTVTLPLYRTTELCFSYPGSINTNCYIFDARLFVEQ